jgi:EmrB/QacA subfamily drug resistance transporter
VSAVRRRWAALAVVCASLLVIVVDSTIVNVALPTLARDLGADLGDLQWVVDAYTLVFAGLLLPAGALGDRHGRRRTLLAGLTLFGPASAAAALAGSVEVLVACRAAMGVGAALIMPATLSLVATVFTDPRERATAVGIWAATAGLGVALGPLLGGLLLDHFAWGAIFLVNVPLCAAALVAGRALLPTSRDVAAPPVDWPGAALSGLAVTAAVWALIESPAHGWVRGGVLEAWIVAVAAGLAFVRRQRRVPAPLLDLGLFRDRRFAAGSLAITALFFALFGFLFLATQYLQFVLGCSPSAAGVRVLPYAGTMIVVAVLSPAAAERWGTARVVPAGMLLFAAGLGIAATVDVGSGYGRLALALVLMGAGMGLAGAPATEAITASLPPERANVGSAVNDTTRELGGALGVAVAGSILASLYSARLGDAVPEPARRSLGAAVGLGDAVAGPAREAFVAAMGRVSLVVAIVAAIGAVAVWRRLAAPGADVRTPVPAPAGRFEG